ncbi:hypothetical protein Leryth_026270, partial [Lithospermum erythrorhizon]
TIHRNDTGSLFKASKQVYAIRPFSTQEVNHSLLRAMFVLGPIFIFMLQRIPFTSDHHFCCLSNFIDCFANCIQHYSCNSSTFMSLIPFSMHFFCCNFSRFPHSFSGLMQHFSGLIHHCFCYILNHFSYLIWCLALFRSHNLADCFPFLSLILDSFPLTSNIIQEKCQNAFSRIRQFRLRVA